MKRLVMILLLMPLAVKAQKYPDYDPTKVRITEPGRTIIAHTAPGKATVDYHDRPYFWYVSNAIHWTQGGFSGHLLHGQYQEFYADKNLREQGEFKNGLKDGIWQSWTEAGALKEYVTWKEGQRDGAFELYSSDGVLLQSGQYKKNLLAGKIRNYKGTDSVQIVRYKAGKLVIKEPGKPSLWQKIKHFSWRKKKPVQATR